MKKLLLILLCLPISGISQNTDYELEFNSTTQDYVQVPNASSTIANKTAFSISCWVNPQANTTHSGIMGFRNNTDADFYLLQLQNTNTIEARFRNSSGLNYDITVPNLLDFNQWQHLAFTYDGGYIRLYKDGIIIDSAYANGIIIQSTQLFKLAALDYQTDVFNMNGRLDEVRLWDVALSQTEINNWMCIPIDATHLNYNNLMGYWRLNEGVGTTIIDLSINGNNGLFINNPFWDLSTTCFASTTQTLTYTPDDNFEQRLIDLGYDNVLDDYVVTASIDTVTILDVSSENIADLTGIEAFSALNWLQCNDNLITSLDVSQNTALTYLQCQSNQLTSLNVNQNTALIYLYCHYNQIISLDISQNPSLIALNCQANQLISLDVRNGNNINMDLSDWSYFSSENNPNLYCINVDDAFWSTANWTIIDLQHYFSNNCSATSVEEHSSKKEFLKVTDLLGREKKQTNQPLFYIYDDGTVEKRIVIE